jgi:hypothetical protein
MAGDFKMSFSANKYLFILVILIWLMTSILFISDAQAGSVPPASFAEVFKSHIVTRPDGSTYTESTYSPSGSINGNVKLEDGTLNLNGQTLTIYGDLIQSGGTLNVNGGKLVVTGDYRIQTPTTDGKGYTLSSGILHMADVNDWVQVGGAFVMETGGYGYYNATPHNSLIAGTLEVKGDFTQKYWNGDYPKNFYAQGTHRVLLSGSTPQKVSFDSPGRDYSHFNI